MSLPLLQTSPSVQLEIDADDKLAANVVPSPAPYNALRTHSNGLWSKPGSPAYQWQIGIISATAMSLTTQVDQVLSWNNEIQDPDGMVDLVAAPTRVTIPESGRYFHNVFASLVLSGGTAVAAEAFLYLRKNGTTFAGGKSCYMQLAAGFTTIVGGYSGYLDAVAGDYYEAVWRFIVFATLTATSVALQALNTTQWQGFRWRSVGP